MTTTNTNKQLSRQESDILHTVKLHGSCSINELAQQLSVSEETIRRHVRPLAAKGFVNKVHGGVVLPDRFVESPYRRRMQENREAKQRIGEKVAELIEDGDSLIIDSGTTTTYVAHALRNHARLTVVTNSIEIASILATQNHNRVFITGGELRPEDSTVFGHQADQMVSRFSVKFALLSIGSINAGFELLDFHLAEADFSRMALAQAEHVIVAADHSKFSRQGLVKVCGLDAVDTLVSDVTIAKSLQKKAEFCNTRLIQA